MASVQWTVVSSVYLSESALLLTPHSVRAAAAEKPQERSRRPGEAYRLALPGLAVCQHAGTDYPQLGDDAGSWGWFCGKLVNMST